MAVNRPNNYENTPTGEYQPPELGGHKLIIKQISEKQSSTGKPMIVVLFDFADDDKQPGYFSEQFANDIRPDKKWPNQATQYVLTEDADGKCTRNFRYSGEISSVSASREKKSVACSGSRWTTTTARKRKSVSCGGLCRLTRLRMLPFLI